MSTLPPLNLVLDMDELLVHAYKVDARDLESNKISNLVHFKHPKKNVINKFGVKASKTGDTVEVIVDFVKRPGLDEFFEQLAGLNNVSVNIWTNSEPLYADAILDHILPASFRNSAPRYYRKHCKTAKAKSGKDIFYKDVRKFWKKELNRTVIFDDNKNNFVVTPNNGYEAIRWEGVLTKEPEFYMENMLEIIRKLVVEKDVRKAKEKLQEALDDAALEPPMQHERMSVMRGMTKSFFNLGGGGMGM
uniref:Mitochondrial import inner membrane translocase subunit TIM50 n=1 Tax=Aplanochytrium stocchinoi TaxID=215587 RepID=A0A7S3LHB5_9STRA|mmetsp:Transcript_4291/g.5401  ORF Transcript_4291/g.5401 Transcript_4291/m.5401 type:complete len:247 (+) Transcript_4291:50-790(+)|eukprot:CAMPEP_0204842552 /NCGR_PEP_ID=MMETSP1346-20131115/46874_1 /ASSEMBLY_ACC=CAM_ASM_000771 /TAXON_ID=215587 /ORGANISM="Aplanochytrium stocchinoi, Strain GSBS06" /LENGTH=246 /DNA_ID=CAMNT_0051981457 /DNA_START=324 /DNA_END=1064 /DNA_ORIENTATION=+